MISDMESGSTPSSREELDIRRPTIPSQFDPSQHDPVQQRSGEVGWMNGKIRGRQILVML